MDFDKKVIDETTVITVNNGYQELTRVFHNESFDNDATIQIAEGIYNSGGVKCKTPKHASIDKMVGFYRQRIVGGGIINITLVTAISHANAISSFEVRHKGAVISIEYDLERAVKIYNDKMGEIMREKRDERI